MNNENIDPRIIDYLRGTNQYDLFKEQPSKDKESVIESSVAAIEKFHGDVNQAIGWANDCKEKNKKKLFPKKNQK